MSSSSSSSDDSMDSVTPQSPSSHPGTLHFVPPNLCAFEPSKPLAGGADTNTLLWIGGMFDTLLSVTYPLLLAQALGPQWSLMTASLTSAGRSWGTSSIARDAEDMGKIVAYIKEKRPNGKVVIMGHSTGCQDCMEYLVGAKAETRKAVDGIILQASVSDREAIHHMAPKAFINEADQLALKMCREGKGKDVMPIRLTQPVMESSIAITAKRWVDVSSPGPNHTGADDYFSSDLSDERLSKTFGRLPARSPLLILYGSSDESVPDFVDKEALVRKWMRATTQGGGRADESNGGVVPGASHNLNDSPDDVRQDLVHRVLGFMAKLDAGDFEVAGSRI